MIYEKYITSSKTDFLIALSSFITKCGWIINKQTKGELYIKNQKNNFFQIKIDEPLQQQNYAFIIGGSATSFDENKDFNHQPGYVYYNAAKEYGDKRYNNNSSGDMQRPHHAMPVINANDPMCGFLFVGDSANLLIQIELIPGVWTIMLSANLTKSHEFSGGHIVFFRCLLWWWLEWKLGWLD